MRYVVRVGIKEAAEKSYEFWSKKYPDVLVTLVEENTLKRNMDIKKKIGQAINLNR